MPTRKQFSCRLDESTISKLKDLSDSLDWGQGQLIDQAIKLLWRLNKNYETDNDQGYLIFMANMIIEDLHSE